MKCMWKKQFSRNGQEYFTWSLFLTKSDQIRFHTMKSVTALSSVFFALHINLAVLAWAWSPVLHHKAPITFTLQAVSSDISIEVFDGTKGVASTVINEAAEFMMESFWGISGKNSDLLSEQVSDLEVRHGEILGKRKLFSNLITAKSGKEIIGMVGVEVALIDLKTKDVLNYKQSEKTLTDAVASLGPKERRQYKDATIEELITQIPSLAGNFEAVAVLANLCVSPSSRGMGLGKNLCEAAEGVVSNKWEMGKLMLKVENENVSAKNLYEALGFVLDYTNKNAMAIRPENNSFCEIPCEVLTMRKML